MLRSLLSLGICPRSPRNSTAVNSSHLQAIYSSVDVRLNTLANWPPRMHTNLDILAGNGVFYTRTGTRLQCIYCSGIANYSLIGNTLTADTEIHYHDCIIHHGQRLCLVIKMLRSLSSLNIRRRSPQNNIAVYSSHLQDICSSVDLRVPVNASYCINDEEEMERVGVRLNTFANWPPRTHANLDILAGDGLFYTGAGTCLQCIYCSGIANYSLSGNMLEADREIHYLDCVIHHGLRHVERVTNLLCGDEAHVLLEMGYSRGRIRDMISRLLLDEALLALESHDKRLHIEQSEGVRSESRMVGFNAFQKEGPVTANAHYSSYSWLSEFKSNFRDIDCFYATQF